VIASTVSFHLVGVCVCATEGREKVTGHAVPSGAVDPAGPMTCRAGVCNKRLLGEIALQLDTRILHYIFTPTQPRSSNSNQPPHPHPHHDVTPATGVLLCCRAHMTVVLSR